MQPTHSASLRAPNQNQDAQEALNGFDVRRRIDGDDILVRDAGSRRYAQPQPPLTRSQIEELISADHRKNEFMAMLSHELRSPLGSIQNAISVLRDGALADEDAARFARRGTRA